MFAKTMFSVLVSLISANAFASVPGYATYTFEKGSRVANLSVTLVLSEDCNRQSPHLSQANSNQYSIMIVSTAMGCPKNFPRSERTVTLEVPASADGEIILQVPDYVQHRVTPIYWLK